MSQTPGYPAHSNRFKALRRAAERATVRQPGRRLLAAGRRGQQAVNDPNSTRGLYLQLKKTVRIVRRGAQT